MGWGQGLLHKSLDFSRFVSMKQDCPCCLEVFLSREVFCQLTISLTVLIRTCSRQYGPPACCRAGTTCMFTASETTPGLKAGRAAPCAAGPQCTPFHPSRHLDRPLLNRSPHIRQLMIQHLDAEIARCVPHRSSCSCMTLSVTGCLCLAIFWPCIPAESPCAASIAPLCPRCAMLPAPSRSTARAHAVRLSHHLQVAWHPFGNKCQNCSRCPRLSMRISALSLPHAFQLQHQPWRLTRRIHAEQRARAVAFLNE